MAICPHCNTDSIHPLRKWWAGSANPVTCSQCGGLSYVKTYADIKVNAVTIFTFAFGLFLSFRLQSLLPVVLGSVLSLVAFIYGWSGLPLVPTTASSFAATRWWRWGFVLAFYVCAGMAYFFTRR